MKAKDVDSQRNFPKLKEFFQAQITEWLVRSPGARCAAIAYVGVTRRADV
jgi:hypothetical protein